MRYWDSSALVPLMVIEAASSELESLLTEDGAIATWWGTPVECASAIGRRERARSAELPGISLALRKLAALETNWIEVAPSERVREVARRLVRVHELRAADALQLAAATRASEGHAVPLPFVTLDDRLALAARREGFPLLPG